MATKAVETVVYDYLLNAASEIDAKNKLKRDKRIAVSAAKDFLATTQLEEVLKKIFHKGWYGPIKYNGKRLHSPHKRIVSIFQGDEHLGAHIDGEECVLQYGAIEESRRLGKVGLEVAEYKSQHRKESKLVVNLIGDIMQGKIHDLCDGDVMTNQFCAALKYHIELLMFWATQYSSIEVYCQPGNHGRDTSRHPERAVNQKWDAQETRLYIAIREAVLNAGINHVKFFIPKTPYCIIPLFNEKAFVTHGDTELKPGNPNKSINIANLERQILKWNTSRYAGGPFKLFACGHIHTASITDLPGRVVMLTNGCLVPPDGFAGTIGISDVTCCQYIIESTPEYIVGDRRPIYVDDADKQSKYNDIVTPFRSI